MHRKNQSERNPGGPLSYRQMRDPRDLTSATQEESSEGRVVQQKGRFKVTSADANSKVAPLTSYVVSPTGGAPASSTVNLASALPSLQFLLQQNATQKEQLIKLIKCLEQTSGRQDDIFEAGPGDMLQLSQSSSRQRELQAYVVHLQQSVGKLAEELQRFKFKNAQLESQLRNMVSKEGIRKTKEAHG